MDGAIKDALREKYGNAWGFRILTLRPIDPAIATLINEKLSEKG